MSDIFREVDEALQKEKAAKLWKTYGPTLVLAAIVMVVSTGIATTYRSWNHGRNQEETTKIVLAAESKDAAAALEKAAGDTRDGHEAVALLNAASRHADKKEFAKAAELYDKVASDSAAPSDLRDIAQVYYVRSAMLDAGDKAPDYKKFADRLKPVADKEKSPFHLQAKLDAALLYGDGLKDYTTALDLLKGFDGETVPDSLKEKANALQHVYQYEQSKPTAPDSAATPATK